MASSKKTKTRIPTEDDFSRLTSNSNESQNLHTSLIYPSPRESTTSIMILFHGLGDNESSFASFARNLNLPGVLGISVRGTSPLPSGLFSDELFDLASGAGMAQAEHFHWGDDLRLDSSSSSSRRSGDDGKLDTDPGFEAARNLIMNRLIGEVLIQTCGWELDDILLFGFGQGGTFALGLASMLRAGASARVQEITDEQEEETKQKDKVFKGVVSIGGPLPVSMVPTVSSRAKSKTHVLICHGRESEAVDEDALELVRDEFEHVRVVEWKGRNKGDDGMPRNREEVLPMMQFFAERLRAGWS